MGRRGSPSLGSHGLYDGDVGIVLEWPQYLEAQITHSLLSRKVVPWAAKDGSPNYASNHSMRPWVILPHSEDNNFSQLQCRLSSQLQLRVENSNQGRYASGVWIWQDGAGWLDKHQARIEPVAVL